MMKIFSGAASAMALLLSTQTAAAHDLKSEVQETYALSGFDKITVTGVYILDIKVGDDFSIKTSGSTKDMEKIDVYVDDGALVLGLKDRKNLSKVKDNNSQGVHAIVTLPVLNAIEVAGVATGEVTGVDARRFELDFAGVGEVEFQGVCQDLTVNMAGVGELNAKALKCEDVEVNLAGVGEASVYASNSIDATAAGMGQIDVHGRPDTVEKTSAFMASVDIK